MNRFRLVTGTCPHEITRLKACSFDSVVTDPPYHLTTGKGGKKGFMDKAWDGGNVAFLPETWAEVLRVVKPGAYLLAFGGTRTYHRLVCAVEDGGWEIRDALCWLYGSGFPKSLDVSKAIDKEAGVEREVIGTKRSGLSMNSNLNDDNWHNANGDEASKRVAITSPATDAAKQWQGFGTALKPAMELIVCARKPITGTVASNVQRYGTGALNIDGSRIETSDNLNGGAYTQGGNKALGIMNDDGWTPKDLGGLFKQPTGRWPANVLLSEDVAETFPQSRFMYCAKASKSDRGKGNNHNTVKPTPLMQWLCRLVTLPGGVILDPFTGSGSTGVAALREGFRFVGIDESAEYLEIARRRLEEAQDKGMSHDTRD